MVKSKSETYLNNHVGVAPLISSNMAKSVSQFRSQLLADEVADGKFRDGNSNSPFVDKNSSTPAGFVTSSSRGFKKFADGSTTSSGSIFNQNGLSGGAGGFRGPNNAMRQNVSIYSPLWLNSNLNLPRDRATINAWSRAFFALNGLIQNSLTLHATYPISKLNIKCKDPKQEQFFNDMIEEIDLMNICVQIAQEYWVLGEAFVYAELDEGNRKWSRLLIQNPDYVVVQPSYIANEPLISLRPDDTLRRLCNSNKPSDVQQRQKLDKTVVEHVRRGENIPLNNFYISHISRKINPYDVRGTGIIVSCFRQLMLFDWIREAKFAQMQNMINPTTLVKIGGEDYKPTPADLEAWRNIFEEAQNDPDFKIFTHDKVAVERVGWNSGILDTGPDTTQLIKEIYTSLMVPSVLMDGGSDTTYANGGVALDVLRQRYFQFRNMMTSWIRRKIFAPIAKINDFYENVDGKKVLSVPDVEWNHMSLFDVDTYVNMLNQLATPENKRCSYQTLYRSLGLNYDDEVIKMRQEDIQSAIREKELESLKAMSLNELRSLKPTEEIQEVKDEAGGDVSGLPGVSSGGAEPTPTPASNIPTPQPPTPSSPPHAEAFPPV